MKVFVITGAGTGLGAEIAKCYGEAENHMILVGRTVENLENTAEAIRNQGGTAECMICDIRNYNQVRELGSAVIKKYGSIDYLINNAGVGYFGSLESITLEQVNDIIDTNVKGTIFMTQALLPYIKERILNIISTAGLKGKVNESVYVSSKYAVRGFTESLHKELEGRSLKVTAVYMGGMNTPFWENTTHIKDKSRLKHPAYVAEEIRKQDDGRPEIFIDK
jgi:short-subunit dehydrogenase